MLPPLARLALMVFSTCFSGVMEVTLTKPDAKLPRAFSGFAEVRQLQKRLDPSSGKPIQSKIVLMAKMDSIRSRVCDSSCDTLSIREEWKEFVGGIRIVDASDDKDPNRKAMPLGTCDYSSGVSVRNADTLDHKLTYSCNEMTARICWLNDPTKATKNGLSSVEENSSRAKASFRWLHEKQSGSGASALGQWTTVGMLKAGGEICCLCTTPTTVEVDGMGKAKVGNGEVLVILGDHWEIAKREK